MCNNLIDSWADMAIRRPPQPMDYIGVSRLEAQTRAAAICIAAAIAHNYDNVGAYLKEYTRIIYLQ